MTTAHTFRRAETVLAEARVRHVAVDPKTLTKTPWPEEVRTAFTPLLDPSAIAGQRAAGRTRSQGLAQSAPGMIRTSRTAPSPRAAMASW